jgi:5-methylcytosine-specific restriction endonuclease McrA
MRPVTRGSWPVDAAGRRKQFADSNYKGFFTDLLDNFGFYCSYCEKPDNLDVEHVIPKSSSAGANLVVDWNNLLLGCPTCNRDYKKNKNQTRANYAWPDEIDTFKFYDYCSSGNLKVSTSLIAQSDKDKAQATIDLCGLAPKPKKTVTESKDFLWHKRMQVWEVADGHKKDYLAGTTTVDKIVGFAVMSGYWSIWITVFNGHNDVINAISDAYKGTKSDYCTLP